MKGQNNLDVHIYADDILVTFGVAQSVENNSQQWYGVFLNCNQLLKLWKVVCGAFVTTICFHIILQSLRYTVRAAKAVRDILSLVHKVICSLMPGESLQIARLAREVANFKGRLAFLWNAERNRRERTRREANTCLTSRTPAVGIAAGPLFGPLQYQVLCAFLGGLFSGCLLSIGCVSLGIWISNTF